MPAKTRISRSRGGGGSHLRERGAKPLRQNPFLALLSTVRTEMDTRLAGLLDAKMDAAKEHGPEVVDMVHALRDLCLRGGKRLRAGLLVAAYRTVSPDADLEPALDAGVAVELLHAYLLVHDDWMDEDAVRRGGPAVHTMLARKYRSAKLGQRSAVLVGDLGSAFATEALSRVEAPAARLSRVLTAFAQMQSDAVAGQQLDVVARKADIEKTYALKTSSYTVAGPLRMGALLAGGTMEFVAELERFALPVGIAFQLRDDILSAFGDPQTTGKPFANDIRSGKRTLLMRLALEGASRGDQKILKRAWGNPAATKKELADAVSALERSGARKAVEERIESYAARATEAVESLEGPNARGLLRGAVLALMDRWS
jgi:geranylgeranyl diphosphate synthase, type I